MIILLSLFLVASVVVIIELAIDLGKAKREASREKSEIDRLTGKLGVAQADNLALRGAFRSLAEMASLARQKKSFFIERNFPIPLLNEAKQVCQSLMFLRQRAFGDVNGCVERQPSPKVSRSIIRQIEEGPGGE